MPDEPAADQPGQDRPPGQDATPTRQLDRAPGERYRGMGTGAGSGPAATASKAPPVDEARAGSTLRAILAGAGMAASGAVLYAALGQIELGAGLLAVAVFIGWMVSLAVLWGAGRARPIPRQWLIAGLLGAGSIVAGLLLATAWARVEGGVLGPFDYTNERYGPLAYLEVLVAGAVAAIRAR